MPIVNSTSSDSQKVKVSGTDTLAEYLNDKLIAGTNVTITKTGTPEKLTIAASGGGGGSFDPNTILTGPSQSLYAGPTAPLEVLIDNNGNVLIGI